MRIQTEISDLTAEEFDYLQGKVKAEYEIPADTASVCLTFGHGEVTRHVEMTLGDFTYVTSSLMMWRAAPVFKP